MSKLDEVLERTRAEEPEDAPDEEPEQPDEQETPGEDAPAAPEPPEPPAGVDEKALERTLTNHRKALQKVLGDGFADMQPCETCFTMGYVAADFTPPPPTRPDPGLVVCEDCNGYGQRTTPSLNPQYELVPCQACQGTGYRDAGQLESIRAAAAYAAAPTPPPIPPPPVWDQTRGGYVDHLGNLLTSGNPNGAPVLNYAGPT